MLKVAQVGLGWWGAQVTKVLQGSEKLEIIFDDHRKKMAAVRSETQAKVDDVLTKEQKEKMDGLRDKRGERMMEKWKERGEKRSNREDGEAPRWKRSE